MDDPLDPAWHKLAFVLLVAVLGIAPMAFQWALTDWDSPAIRTAVANSRFDMWGYNHLTLYDIRELEKRVAAHFIPDVVNHPAIPHNVTATSWRTRVIGIYSVRLTDAEKDTYLKERRIDPVVAVEVAAELIPSENTCPEMRYATYYLDRRHEWRPRVKEEPIHMGTWASWYF